MLRGGQLQHVAALVAGARRPTMVTVDAVLHQQMRQRRDVGEHAADCAASASRRSAGSPSSAAAPRSWRRRWRSCRRGACRRGCEFYPWVQRSCAADRSDRDRLCLSRHYGENGKILRPRCKRCAAFAQAAPRALSRAAWAGLRARAGRRARAAAPCAGRGWRAAPPPAAPAAREPACPIGSPGRAVSPCRSWRQDAKRPEPGQGTGFQPSSGSYPVMARATAAPSAPRLRSWTRPSWLTMKVMTPEAPYFAGNATRAKPPVMCPSTT